MNTCGFLLQRSRPISLPARQSVALTSHSVFHAKINTIIKSPEQRVAKSYTLDQKVESPGAHVYQSQQRSELIGTFEDCVETVSAFSAFFFQENTIGNVAHERSERCQSKEPS